MKRKTNLTKLTSTEQKFYDQHKTSMVLWEMMQTEFPRLKQYSGPDQESTQHYSKNAKMERIDTLILKKVVTVQNTTYFVILHNKVEVSGPHYEMEAACDAYDECKANLTAGLVGESIVKQNEIITTIK